MKDRLSTNKDAQQADMKNYYKVQAKIYDLTRWLFLFGRFSVWKHVPFDRQAAISILDVGCGTGVNSAKMARLFPNAHITALDVSEDMLAQAAKRLKPFGDKVSLVHQPYEKNPAHSERYDLIHFSYALTMINPQWQDLLEQAQADLKPGGVIVVADFHDTPVRYYKKFMRANHVRLDGHLLPVLKQMFRPVFHRVGKGYLGVWEYFQFVGQRLDA
ncbi:MAG TPA: 16S rRNA (cytosine(1402)-N(4))-methyltransferase [Microscillaceae bacterium]|jgi:S-adenosylmethionine-diacylgycerolhomoserine-N-methlytransferase|nr:16S rRNA (cytosine(1402)-N(4))-methyltransferase [Microscillaceae bacterium]